MISTSNMHSPSASCLQHNLQAGPDRSPTEAISAVLDLTPESVVYVIAYFAVAEQCNAIQFEPDQIVASQLRV
jgi:hypothetical protein